MLARLIGAATIGTNCAHEATAPPLLMAFTTHTVALFLQNAGDGVGQYLGVLGIISHAIDNLMRDENSDPDAARVTYPDRIGHCS